MGQTDGYHMASWGLNNCSLDKFDNLGWRAGFREAFIKNKPTLFYIYV